MQLHSNKSRHIAIVSDHLAGGGAERFSAMLSLFLEKNNQSVTHILVLDEIEYAYSGAVVNLGKIKSHNAGFWNRIKRFLVLYKTFKANKFDCIIDTRVRSKSWQEWFITKMIFNTPYFVVVHSYNTELYFTQNNFLAKRIFTHATKIIGVSKAITNKIEQRYKYPSKYISIAIDLSVIDALKDEALDIHFSYILAVGSMHTDVKQYDVLLKMYSQSSLMAQNIHLILLGEGKLMSKYIKLASDLDIENYVHFLGRKSNPYHYFKNALFTVLTSKFEGFPTVLLESLACNTPVVAFNCMSGPDEIISNRENGLIIEPKNQEAFIDALNTFYANKDLYLHCKNNARASVLQYNIEEIGNKWLQLLHEHGL
ncbi:N-acetylgalactosamine-N,N'-diacetylbacillosaminyl-diphospho-undecaprenol 4-alpha-N-acetylgalactosaminyltransferase [Flavobacterium croceum DSM 17960]|uniref:N-acetylgalactosamine-N, N'-diacetylbacillosaminyl-diphospho-undecaprenol 4-alpha-N-acetylgalactosaminyltransferase n=1 Tax=Flavobacterium croceum DSM 17960 TaxID=1121886 RepID=A0A2S4N5W9_9FLAO|nr:glycosyltransferase [Flavobacterium croceum]POS01111.1 N-acetylgalactosamine-N,N'-diacetylbacillosaminyl-diphospho-undecaprenol 4-alpha-N-acetylgalactosaminyltransferase [Flavobacterium croceum DSM 17960]